MRTTARALLLLLSGFALVASPVHAQKRLRVVDFRVELTVNEDGTMQVLESIQYEFTGSWNGVFRDIPINYQAPGGLNYRLILSDISARDESGELMRLETSRERHLRRIKVWVPGAENVSRTIHFRYTVKNGLRFFDGGGEGFSDGYDELYWNATGGESEIPISSSSVTVHLPSSVTGRQAKVYTGRSGSTASDATITEIEDGFYFRANRGLQPFEGMTVDIAWDPGVIHRPTRLDRATELARANWILIFPFLSFYFMWRHWRAKGKDPARRPISPQYEPPEGMTPAEIGTLIDNRPDMRDITASIVDLAVRGYIKIEQRDEKILGLFSNAEYTFHRIPDGPDWNTLTEFENRLLTRLFALGTGTTVDTEDLQNEFYEELGGLKDLIFSRLIASGYYNRRPDHVIGTYLGIGLAVMVLGIFVAIRLSDPLGLPTSALAIAVIGSVLPLIVFGPFMSRRTKAGARALEGILGFQEFLNRVEADHFRRMIDSPEMFERFLPHAMALGVETKWAKAFEDIYTDPPGWYIGHTPGRFSAGVFAHSMTDLSSRTASVMRSQPRSSGGSGFSGGGGGFSGGGFGGGGTGGF